jgi:uncharacterized protein YjbI with pentapeptide repeats
MEKGELTPKRKHFPKIASLLNITLEEFFDLVGEQLINEGIIFSISEDGIYLPNKRHFNVLNRGVKLWNRWRIKNYRVRSQLAGAKPKEDYLDEIDLHHSDLRGSYFQNKSLRSSIIWGSDLRKSDLRGSDLTGANLSEANLTGASLCRANFKRANFSNADLSFADMREAILNDANFEYAILKYCYVYGISDWNTNFNKAVQKKLSICPYKTQTIYVDCIENARLKLLEI